MSRVLTKGSLWEGLAMVVDAFAFLFVVGYGITQSEMLFRTAALLLLLSIYRKSPP